MEQSKWLVPGLENRQRDEQYPPHVVLMQFGNICVPYEGGAMHDAWESDFIPQLVDKEVGFVFTSYKQATVEWNGERMTPFIHCSIDELNEMFPVPTPAQ